VPDPLPALWPTLGPGAWALCIGAILVGTVVQRLAGQAFGMIATPLVALVAPEHVPGALLCLGFVIALTASTLDFAAIERREIAPGFAGRAAGGGAAVLVALSLTETDGIRVAVGLVVLAGVALSLSGLRVAIRPASLFLAGLASGLMGTLTAVGAPPMALLYQREPAKRARAMQNLFLLWGMVVSIGLLALAGLLGLPTLVFALALSPPMLLGLGLGQMLARRVERASLRPWALGLSTLSALALLGKVWFDAGS
jgi:uncharacterized membrane protein YfcA